jgi:GGDEF domain-containing protein
MDRNGAIDEERERLSELLDDLEHDRATQVQHRLRVAFRTEAEARLIGATDLEMRARLIQADMLQRTGQTTTAAAMATEVNRWAREHGPRPLLARSHLILAAIFENVGDSATCLDHALRALELLDDTTLPRTRGNFMARLADAFALIGSFDSARQRYREAEKIFVALGDVERQLNVLNNLAYNESLAGNIEEARQAAGQLRTLATAGEFGLNPAFLDTLARVHIGLGEFEEAEVAIRTALDMLGSDGDVQAVTPAELTLTLAEVQRKQGRLEVAKQTLDRCREICIERALAGMEVEVMREQAELHAAAGEFVQAYETFKVYHARSVTLSSSQHEAAARTRQALFETAEARQEAQRYWRQARTDELTKLPNRRFVDEELPGRLSEVAGGKPLVVAIVDADHFKLINDTLSHEAGDRVIAELAIVLLAGVAGPREPGDRNEADDAPAAREAAAAAEASPRFVARLGGEEFLVVLPGMSLRAAADLLEGLRAAVYGHDWRPIVGGLRVAVSIGATSALPYDTQSDVLTRADRSLYEAKRAGRNRVVVDSSAVK